MVIVLQERCFLSTCSDLADDTKTKSEVVAHCLVVAEAMLSVFPLSCAGMRQDSADAGARDGSDPCVGMRLCATHRLVLLQTFSKDI